LIASTSYATASNAETANECVAKEADTRAQNTISPGISMPPSNQAILQVSHLTKQIKKKEYLPGNI